MRGKGKGKKFLPSSIGMDLTFQLLTLSEISEQSARAKSMLRKATCRGTAFIQHLYSVSDIPRLMRRAEKMMRNKIDATSIATLLIGIIDAYVLLFSTISILYKVLIVVISFFLLLLVTLALHGLETMQKPTVR